MDHWRLARPIIDQLARRESQGNPYEAGEGGIR